jgi:hypothetical protein
MSVPLNVLDKSNTEDVSEYFKIYSNPSPQATKDKFMDFNDINNISAAYVLKDK